MKGSHSYYTRLENKRKLQVLSFLCLYSVFFAKSPEKVKLLKGVFTISVIASLACTLYSIRSRFVSFYSILLATSLFCVCPASMYPNIWTFLDIPSEVSTATVHLSCKRKYPANSIRRAVDLIPKVSLLQN